MFWSKTIDIIYDSYCTNAIFYFRVYFVETYKFQIRIIS